MYDLIILGAGPAGLTAALYAGRRLLKTLVISKDLGGQIAKTPAIENYPGFEEISGGELIQKMLSQAQKSGAEIIFEDVEKIEKGKNIFTIHTPHSKYQSKALILAYGKTPRSLDAKGEKEFLGKGVSYCATCDMPLFKNKIISIVGGGNSALDAALYGSKIAKKVYLIHRRDEFRGDEVLVENMKKEKNIEFVLSSIVKEVKGNKFVNSIIVEDVSTKKSYELQVNGLFIEAGYEVKTDFVEHLVKLDEFKQIVIDNNCATSCPGIFAAGDITNTKAKQAIVAAGDGAKAALAAYGWLRGDKTPTADWSHNVWKP